MMALHRPSRIPFIGHFSAISRSFFGRFRSFFGRFSAILAQKTPLSARFSADSAHTIRPAIRPAIRPSDVQKPIQPRLHVLAGLLPALPGPTVGRHMAVVAEASQITSIEGKRAHLLPAPSRTNRAHMVHLLGGLVHDTPGHTFLAERMGADIRRPKRMPPLRVNNALVLLPPLPAPPVSTTASTASLLCISFPAHIDRPSRRE